MKYFSLALCLFVFMMLFACGEQYSVNQKSEIKKEGWSYDDKLSFSFEVKDTNQLYDLFLQIDHTVDFPRQNIYVNIYTGKKDAQLEKRQLSLEIGNKLGQWLGKCNGENCENLIPLQTNTFFDSPGVYVFELEQYTRLNPLPNISSISFLAKETSKK